MSMLGAATPLARLTSTPLTAFVRAACRRSRPVARLLNAPAAAHARWVATAADIDPADVSRPLKAPTTGKQRLDELTIAQHPEHSRTVVQSWIAQGKVLVDGQPVMKAGTKVKTTVTIHIIAEQPKFVCRGGLKLEKALDFFDIDVTDKIALDSGLSTGGFTDCLLQRGAKKVYGVDVGYGQVAEKIRVHPRAVVMERTNLRYLQPLPDVIDVACLDLSFISVLKVLPAVAATMKPSTGELIVLIKPQFEAHRKQIGAKGVVRDPEVHEEVIRRVILGAAELGFAYRQHTVSPIKGAKEGNTEFLAYFIRDGKEMPPHPEGPITE
jgi:23S rRNA (cytidine1920-2'-O)/16S rRNA (cytidine1409-2'-O)-methyltransferase